MTRFDELDRNRIESDHLAPNRYNCRDISLLCRGRCIRRYIFRDSLGPTSAQRCRMDMDDAMNESIIMEMYWRLYTVAAPKYN